MPIQRSGLDVPAPALWCSQGHRCWDIASASSGPCVDPILTCSVYCSTEVNVLSTAPESVISLDMRSSLFLSDSPSGTSTGCMPSYLGSSFGPFNFPLCRFSWHFLWSYLSSSPCILPTFLLGSKRLSKWLAWRVRERGHVFWTPSSQNSTCLISFNALWLF